MSYSDYYYNYWHMQRKLQMAVVAKNTWLKQRIVNKFKDVMIAPFGPKEYLVPVRNQTFHLK